MENFESFIQMSPNDVHLCGFYDSLRIYDGAPTCKEASSVLTSLLFVVLRQLLLQDFIVQPHFI